MRQILLGIVWCGLVAPAYAAAPKLDLLFPCGAARGATATIAITGADEPWPVQVWSSRPDLQIKALDEKGKLSITVPADAIPGVAWIRLHNAEGASSTRPFVIGTLPEFEEVEPNNAVKQAQVLTGSSVVVNGKHQANNDVDTFQLSLKAGQTLVADLQASRQLGSPADPVLQILNAQGFVLDQNDDDQGLDPRLIFRVPSDGIYFIRTFAFPAATNSSIHFSGGANWVYRLTLTTDGFVEHTLPLSGVKGQANELLAYGWNLGSDPVKVTVAAQDAERSFVSGPQFGNLYGIKLGSIPVLNEQTTAPNQVSQILPVPCALSGVVHNAGTADSFQFPAKKGQALQISVAAGKLGSQLDPVLVIADLKGKQLQRVDDQGENRDPELTWNPPADGDYLVKVEDLHGRGGSRFFYQVSIVVPQPDFQLTVAGDAFVVPVGKPLEIPVTIDRRAGFKSEIEISIQGLPDGVTATSVKSVGDGDTAKAVKLNVTGNPAAFSGVIRIVGTALQEPKITHTARLNLSDFQSEIEDLWLTVLKP